MDQFLILPLQVEHNLLLTVTSSVKEWNNLVQPQVVRVGLLLPVWGDTYMYHLLDYMTDCFAD